MENQYNLTALPSYAQATIEGGDYFYERDGKRLTNAEAAALIKWSGIDPAPAIGERVRVAMNSLGYGTVSGYYIEHGYLGVYVKLDNPPAWYVNQNGRSVPATVFGAELGVKP